MRTVFALFESYREANKAVEELIEKHFDEREMNVIVQELAAKSTMDINFRTSNVDKSRKMGSKSAERLDHLVAGRRPFTVPDVGAVYAAGEMATVLARSAATPESPPASLREALVDFDVPKEIADFYTEGVLEGGVLLWLRIEDERAGEAANVLSQRKGDSIFRIPISGGKA